MPKRDWKAEVLSKAPFEMFTAPFDERVARVVQIDRVVGAHIAADTKAGVSARDEEEASAVRVADADVLSGGSLARKIGSLSACNGSEASGGAEKKARFFGRTRHPDSPPVCGSAGTALPPACSAGTKGPHQTGHLAKIAKIFSNRATNWAYEIILSHKVG